MNERTPADPPPVVGKRSLTAAFVPGVSAKTAQSGAVRDAGQPSIEPRRSFFRGVAVGLAIMIPIWTWLIIWLLR
jgi:hypothetical protein